jgi:hypothetical protein
MTNRTPLRSRHGSSPPDFMPHFLQEISDLTLRLTIFPKHVWSVNLSYRIYPPVAVVL